MRISVLSLYSTRTETQTQTHAHKHTKKHTPPQQNVLEAAFHQSEFLNLQVFSLFAASQLKVESKTLAAKSIDVSGEKGQGRMIKKMIKRKLLLPTQAAETQTIRGCFQP